MPTLGLEFVGKLPLGRREVHSQTLAEYQKLYESGIVAGVEISGCDDCSASMAFAGRTFPPLAVPSLPLTGCTRSPCCACVYVANVAQEVDTAHSSGRGIENQGARQSIAERITSWFRS